MMETEIDIPRLRMLREAERQFQEMSQPYYGQIAKIRLLYGHPFMVVSSDNQIVKAGVDMPSEQLRWIAEIEQVIQYLRELAFREYHKYYPDPL